jgi:hypothetical protein
MNTALYSVIIGAKAIFRDACGKRKREDPPGRKGQPQAFSAASEEKRAAGNLK